MTIKYYVKNVYGTDTMYVLDQTIGMAIKTLTGQRTLTPQKMEALKKLGFTFKQVIVEAFKNI